MSAGDLERDLRSVAQWIRDGKTVPPDDLAALLTLGADGIAERDRLYGWVLDNVKEAYPLADAIAAMNGEQHP